jgi:hypothetical protein
MRTFCAGLIISRILKAPTEAAVASEPTNRKHCGGSPSTGAPLSGMTLSSSGFRSILIPKGSTMVPTTMIPAAAAIRKVTATAISTLFGTLTLCRNGQTLWRLTVVGRSRSTEPGLGATPEPLWWLTVVGRSRSTEPGRGALPEPEQSAGWLGRRCRPSVPPSSILIRSMHTGQTPVSDGCRPCTFWRLVFVPFGLSDGGVDSWMRGVARKFAGVPSTRMVAYTCSHPLAQRPLVAAWCCSTTLAGIRPRSLTVMPWSLAQARISLLRWRLPAVRDDRRG